MAFEGQFSIVTNEHQLEIAIQELKDRFEATRYVQIKMTEAKTRTSRQNNALHLYCRMAAKDLNDAGCDQRKVLKPSMSIPWTMESFKENLFKPVMSAMFGHTTTADLKTGQVGEVYDTINRELSEKFGVQTSFPDRGGR